MSNFFKIGNRKIGKDTLIFNMGSATHCPSKALGMCQVKRCYALKAEKMYPSVKPYRDRQAAYWMHHKACEIFSDVASMLDNKRTRNKDTIRYFRFNESGDFYSQTSVNKLDTLAFLLKTVYNIETYGYTARRDLDFSGVSFHVKGSGHDNGNNGKTIIRKMDKKTVEQVKKDWADGYPTIQGMYYICPMDCSVCDMCKKRNGFDICFPLH